MRMDHNATSETFNMTTPIQLLTPSYENVFFSLPPMKRQRTSSIDYPDDERDEKKRETTKTKPIPLSLYVPDDFDEKDQLARGRPSLRPRNNSWERWTVPSLGGTHTSRTLVFPQEDPLRVHKRRSSCAGCSRMDVPSLSSLF